MCTVIVAHHWFHDTPLLVAANRDEQLARPFGPPALRRCGRQSVVVPTDAQAGGTWIGTNESGVFSAITNRFSGPPDAARSSRGELVLEALSHPDASSAASAVASLHPDRYNPFHLVIADRATAWVVRHSAQGLVSDRLGPGIHVVTERSFDAAPTGRDPWLLQEVAGWDHTPPTDDVLRSLLATHGEPTTERTCVHLDVRGYGTRSSSILRFGPDVADVQWMEAPGPPCTTAHQPVAVLPVRR